MGVLLSGCGVAWREWVALRGCFGICGSGVANQGGSMRANLNRHPRHDERSLTISTPRPPRSAPCGHLQAPPAGRAPPFRPPTVPTARSEEHTSELQSLMRISYAVFCLKKKKDTTYTIKY